MDATTELSRKITELGIYPAVDPLGSTSRILDPLVVGKEHYECAQRVKQLLQHYNELQDIIAILGMDELSDEDRLVVNPGTSPYNVSYLSHLLLLNSLQEFQE